MIQFNHLALHVSNLEKSMEFYGEILGLKTLERPAFTFPGAWYEIGNGLQLHLIAGKNYETRSSNHGYHFAFSAPDVNALEHALREKGVEIVTNKLRVDGVRQMFVKDPDGYYVEFNEG